MPARSYVYIRGFTSVLLIACGLSFAVMGSLHGACIETFLTVLGCGCVLFALRAFCSLLLATSYKRGLPETRLDFGLAGAMGIVIFGELTRRGPLSSRLVFLDAI